MAEPTGVAAKGGKLLTEGGFVNVSDQDDGCEDCCEDVCPTDCTACPDPITVTTTGQGGQCSCTNGAATAMLKFLGNPVSCFWSGFNFGPFTNCPFGIIAADIICVGTPTPHWELNVALSSMGPLGLTTQIYNAVSPVPFAPCPPVGATAWALVRTNAPAGGCAAAMTGTTA